MRINNTLKKLFLDVYNRGDKGAISIAFSLKLNHSLKYLNLKYNSEISEKTMQYIASTMRKRNKHTVVDDDPPEHHDNYEKLNNLIRGFFVSSSLERILSDASIEFDQKSIYFDILKQSRASVISLNMSAYTPFDDSVATQLAVSLPPTITSFTFLSVLLNMVSDQSAEV